MERVIRLHANAITENPHFLVSYIDQLLKRGFKRLFRVLFGTVEIQGNQSWNSRDLACFLGVLKPQTIALWSWDTNLIREIALVANPQCIRLPIMKYEGNITEQDFSAISGMPLTKLELFRPFPRQPWGIEAGAFQVLSSIPTLTHLMILSGRLINRHDLFVDAVLQLRQLKVLNLSAWGLSAQHGAQLLNVLSHLTSIQFIHITSPDFWLYLPSYHQPTDSIRNQSDLSLAHLGISFMAPDHGDLANMIQGIIRCLPCLSSLTIRISRPTNSEYEFFMIPRDVLERMLRRLEGKTELKMVVFEIGSRLWSSRKSYGEELELTFQNSKMKVRVSSSLGFER